MSERLFLDTGVFVASFSEVDQRRRGLARGLIREALQRQTAVISHQVVEEFLDEALHRFERPMQARQAHEYLRVVLQPLCQIPRSLALDHDALDLRDRWDLAWDDARILAAAQQGQCTRLYTDGALAGRVFGAVQGMDPFR